MKITILCSYPSILQIPKIHFWYSLLENVWICPRIYASNYLLFKLHTEYYLHPGADKEGARSTVAPRAPQGGQSPPWDPEKSTVNPENPLLLVILRSSYDILYIQKWQF